MLCKKFYRHFISLTIFDNMNEVLLVISIICMVVAIIGSVVPVLPGPTLAWGALLILHLSGYAHFSTVFFIITAVVTAFTIVLDYIVPSWGTRKFGGTKWGTRGANIGIIVGIFMGPLGIVTGPFLGALVGELLYNARNRLNQDVKRAFKSAFGSFVGFLAGTGIKLIVCLIFAWFFFKELF